MQGIIKLIAKLTLQNMEFKLFMLLQHANTENYISQ